MRALLLLALPLGGCASMATIDSALLARSPVVTPQFGPEGLSFLGYRVQNFAWTPWERGEAKYAFEVVTKEGDTVRASCKVRSTSSLVLGDSSNLGCEYDQPGKQHAARYTLGVYGNGTDLLAIRVLDGTMSEVQDLPKGDNGVELRYRLKLRGGATTWNFRLQEGEFRKTEGEWRSSCCRDLTIVAAVELRPQPRLVVDESLSPSLRRSFALAAAALLVLREFQKLEP